MLAANVISVTGDSLTLLGVPWYVLESTGSSARAGVVAFCALLPVAVSAWASGPFIDRIGRRRVSVISDLARGTCVATILLLPVDAREKFGSVLALGMLETVFAACALAGALLYGAVGHRWRRWTVFAVAFLVVGAPRFVVAGLTSSVAALAVMMAVEGLACGALNPIRATVVYETVPAHLRSGVISTMTSAGLLAAPFGGLVAGFLVGTVGLFTTLIATGGVYLAVTLYPVVSASWRGMDS